MKTFLLFLMIYILHTTTKISHDMEKGPKSVVPCMRKRSEWNELKRIRDGRLHTLNWILKIIKLTACNHFSAKYRVAVKIFSLSNSIYIMVGEQQRLEYKLMSCKDKHKVQKKNTKHKKNVLIHIFSYCHFCLCQSVSCLSNRCKVQLTSLLFYFMCRISLCNKNDQRNHVIYNYFK